MAQKLRWEPTHKDILELKDKTLTAVKKRILPTGYAKKLDKKDVPYLEGLLDGGVEEAQDLIDGINQYKSIDLSIIDEEP